VKGCLPESFARRWVGCGMLQVLKGKLDGTGKNEGNFPSRLKLK
jgi:hypothetical protein